MLLRAFIVLMPWRLRRSLLQWIYGYRLHSSAHIGLAWVFPRKLVMERGARIGHLTVAKGMDLISMEEESSIGRLNWLTAYPSGDLRHFSHLRERRPELLLGAHAAITHRHIIDCTEQVKIGRYTTVAGYRSQVLTHSIDLDACQQDAKPVVIGEYCFVGTACTLLGGSVLPDYSVLGANALLNKAQNARYSLYAGVPAAPVARLDPEMKYFSRPKGFVQ
jgi:carbonic anhydrase/acetyltransferase-like protein (isoleucine patch superfamily)